MDDLIRREDVLNGQRTLKVIIGEAETVPVILKRDIEEIPSVDAVEVVRCRECEFWDVPNGMKIGVCKARELGRNWRGPDFFCADGQRREDGDA